MYIIRNMNIEKNYKYLYDIYNNTFIYRHSCQSNYQTCLMFEQSGDI